MLKIKSRFNISWRRTAALFGLVALIAISAVGHSPAQAVVKSYEADKSLETGTIVSLTPDSSDKVEPLTIDNLERMYGVVVNQTDVAITLSSPNQKVFVATTGRFDVLVSDQNGEIKANDYISASNIGGIGMHANIGETLVIGKAVSGFDGKKDVLRKDNATIGRATQQVSIGRIPVDIGIIRNPQAITKTALPNFLQVISTSVAGKSVSAARVYLAAAVLLISLFVSGSLLYSGGRNSMVALGRNPLSKRPIILGLIQVTITSLTVFTGGLFAVYLLLKL